LRAIARSDPVESHLKRDAVEQLTGAHHEGRAVGPIGKVPLVPEPSMLKTSVQVEAVRIGRLGATSLIASGGG
jgi:hypothetical protein